MKSVVVEVEVVLVVMVVLVLVVVIVVVVVGVVVVMEKREDPQEPLLTPTPLPTQQIPPPSLHINQFFLIITAFLKTNITKTTIPPSPSIPYNRHNHHYNPTKTASTMTQHTPNYSTPTTIKWPHLQKPSPPHSLHRNILQLQSLPSQPAKVWNGPGWDKVGIEFTESQLDPNFLPSLATTNHPSILVDKSIFLPKKILKKEVTNKLPPCLFGLNSFVTALVISFSASPS